jgi:hypothetical protein
MAGLTLKSLQQIWHSHNRKIRDLLFGQFLSGHTPIKKRQMGQNKSANPKPSNYKTRGTFRRMNILMVTYKDEQELSHKHNVLANISMEDTFKIF